MSSDELVALSLVLTGGQRVSGRLREGDPMLETLLHAYGGTPGTHPNIVGLLTPDQRGTIFVRPRDIVVLEIDRCMQPAVDQVECSASNRCHKHIIYQDFLSPETNAALLAYAIEKEGKFAPSTITDKTTGSDRVIPEQRVSGVIYDVPEFKRVFIEKVRDRLATLTDLLGLDPIVVDQIECQMTAHSDGAFFKRHRDHEGGGNLGRLISYVYYFNTEPKGYTGGELRLHSASPDGRVMDVEPRNNSIVFFPSPMDHEVLPVICPSRKFVHSRFTVNGWVHAKKSAF